MVHPLSLKLETSPPPAMLRLLLCLLLLCTAWTARAGELPNFANDEEADAWLRKQSPYYAMMATDVDRRGGYKFRTANHPKGMVLHENGQRYIEMNAALVGPERVSILVFELTNAFQEAQHQEVDQRARDGRIADAIHFGLLHELVEYDGLRHHRYVLAELDKVLGGIPREMLTWINPALTTLASYELPYAFVYVEAQAQSGHTTHYHRWFEKQRGVGKMLKR
jgi:hypothetical protein